jgi:hypothetical protein
MPGQFRSTLPDFSRSLLTVQHPDTLSKLRAATKRGGARLDRGSGTPV